MRLLKIEYEKSGSPLPRTMKILIEDNLTVEEIEQEVLNQIITDLGVSQYGWVISHDQ